MTAAEAEMLRAANKFYDSQGGKRLQYINVGWAGQAFKGLPNLSELRTLVIRVVRSRELKALYLTA